MTNYNDGNWHGWNGGECPVHPKSVVEVRLSDRGCEGPDMQDYAAEWMWNAVGEEAIIVFRVVKEYREPREFWIDKQDRQVLERDPKDRVHYIHVREVIK